LDEVRSSERTKAWRISGGAPRAVEKVRACSLSSFCFSLPWLPVVVRGLVIGAALMIGPFLARGIVRRVRPHTYALLIDLVLLAAGGIRTGITPRGIRKALSAHSTDGRPRWPASRASARENRTGGCA
jgi:hypothetical protein